MTSNLIFLFIISLIYLSCRPHIRKTVICDESQDDSCKMYNNRDINSKCTSLCLDKYKTQFSGKHTVKDSIHVCDCKQIKEMKDKEKFTEIQSPDSFLPNIIPDDHLYSDRNYVQNQEEARYNKLIFG